MILLLLLGSWHVTLLLNSVIVLATKTDVSDFPLIYNTYQCYLKDSLDRLRVDVERSERFDYHFGRCMAA